MCSFIPPLCAPTHRLIPFALWKPHRRNNITGSLKLWTAVALLFTQIFLALSAFEGETYSDTTPLLLKHIQKCSTLVFMSWDIQTGGLPPAFAPADIWHARKCKDARGQKQAKTHKNTHWLRLIVMKALRKEMKESQRADYGNTGLYSMEGVVEMIKSSAYFVRHLCIHCECRRQREPILTPNASNTVAWSVARHICVWCCSCTPSIWCSSVKSEKCRGMVGWWTGHTLD